MTKEQKDLWNEMVKKIAEQDAEIERLKSLLVEIAKDYNRFQDQAMTWKEESGH